MPPPDACQIGWFATKGTGTNEAVRMVKLLSEIPGATEWPFQKSRKLASFRNLLQAVRRQRPKLLVMEGTGIAGGLVCLMARLLWKVPYVFSSGDAVGPFIAAHVPIAGPPAAIYEWLLCRWSAGFIGWTPYLCGRAMTFGAPRAVTAPGWVLGGNPVGDCQTARVDWRAQWGIPESAIVVGLLGALEWNRHRQYGYGLELVRAAHRVERHDMVFLIVGDGTGLTRLREEAGSLLGTRIFLPGAVPLDRVIPALSAMDVASLPQSMDGVGLFRYTTKISEYAAAGLPVITSRIPMAYDLGGEWMWRLPGAGPWEETYVGALATLLQTLDRGQIEVRSRAIPKSLDAFQCEPQVRRVTKFIEEIMEGESGHVS